MRIVFDQLTPFPFEEILLRNELVRLQYISDVSFWFSVAFLVPLCSIGFQILRKLP